MALTPPKTANPINRSYFRFESVPLAAYICSSFRACMSFSGGKILVVFRDIMQE